MFHHSLVRLRVLVTLAAVAVLGYALVSDVTQAQKVCNERVDCSTSCLPYNDGRIRGSHQDIQLNTVYRTGSATKRCGVTKIWLNENCQGTPYREPPIDITNACN